VKKRGADDKGYVEEASETSLFCRFFLNCFLAEIHYFPYFSADDFQQKIAVERHFNSLLNLDRARRDGLIANWKLIWHSTSQTRYPQYPQRILITPPKGQLTKMIVPRKILAEVDRIREHGLIMPPLD